MESTLEKDLSAQESTSDPTQEELAEAKSKLERALAQMRICKWNEPDYYKSQTEEAVDILIKFPVLLGERVCNSHIDYGGPHWALREKMQQILRSDQFGNNDETAVSEALTLLRTFPFLAMDRFEAPVHPFTVTPIAHFRTCGCLDTLQAVYDLSGYSEGSDITDIEFISLHLAYILHPHEHRMKLKSILNKYPTLWEQVFKTFFKSFDIMGDADLWNISVVGNFLWCNEETGDYRVEDQSFLEKVFWEIMGPKSMQWTEHRTSLQYFLLQAPESFWAKDLCLTLDDDSDYTAKEILEFLELLLIKAKRIKLQLWLGGQRSFRDKDFLELFALLAREVDPDRCMRLTLSFPDSLEQNREALTQLENCLRRNRSIDYANFSVVPGPKTMQAICDRIANNQNIECVEVEMREDEVVAAVDFLCPENATSTLSSLQDLTVRNLYLDSAFSFFRFVEYLKRFPKLKKLNIEGDLDNFDDATGTKIYNPYKWKLEGILKDSAMKASMFYEVLRENPSSWIFMACKSSTKDDELGIAGSKRKRM